MNVIVTTMPHARQRYATVGDWVADGRGHLRHIHVSELGNEDYHFLVAMHELIEAHLCLKRGVSQHEVDAFDMAFERDRDLGDESEPGDAPAAPYRREHRQAENIERQLADLLGIDWQAYEAAIGELP